MSVTDRPTHWWDDPDGDGHNCDFCDPDNIWKCDEAAHPKPTEAEAAFVRQVVEGIDRFPHHDLTPEQKVRAAVRLVGNLRGDIDLTDEGALYLAALIAGPPDNAASEAAHSDEGSTDEQR